MTTDAKYNGYANYETWCVTLWLENDEGTYNYWREQARQHAANAAQASQVECGYWTPEQAAKFLLADQLKAEFNDDFPLGMASVWSDLLNAALDSVNWDEVAEQFVTDFLPNEKRGASTSSASDETPELPTAPIIIDMVGARFSLGVFVATPGALATIPTDEISAAVSRHLRGDWGLICAEDAQENEWSLTAGARLLSSYDTSAGRRFWIITEADRSVTTVLLPEEY